MKLHDLSAVPGSTKVSKRVGRGHGSGQGKTAGKGHKGQKARSGASIRQVLKAAKCLCKDVYLKRFQQHFCERNYRYQCRFFGIF